MTQILAQAVAGHPRIMGAPYLTDLGPGGGRYRQPARGTLGPKGAAGPPNPVARHRVHRLVGSGGLWRDLGSSVAPGSAHPVVVKQTVAQALVGHPRVCRHHVSLLSVPGARGGTNPTRVPQVWNSSWGRGRMVRLRVSPSIGIEQAAPAGCLVSGAVMLESQHSVSNTGLVSHPYTRWPAALGGSRRA